jgi:tetratricopeptide (TPR) repeat protein
MLDLAYFTRLSAVFAVLLAAISGAQDGSDLDRARRLAQEGQTGAAVEAYEAWTRSHPDDRAALREASDFGFRNRRWFEAAKWLERLVALDPGNPGGWYDLGALRHNQCRFELAVTAFRQLDALEAFDSALAARAEHRYLHGESSRRLEHFAEAISELSLAAARAPDRMEYRKALAQALLDGGRYEAAAQEFAKVVLADPSHENLYGQGLALAESGRVDEAVAALKEARRRKTDPRTLLKLGLLLTRAKDLPRAEAYLVEARELAPRNADVAFALAQVQRLQGRAEEAEQARAAAGVLKKDADAAIERGRVYARGLASNPGEVEAQLRYGVDLLEQSRVDEAQVVFQRLLSYDPRHPIAILNLASLLARHGDGAGALAELKKILEREDGHELANLQAARIKLGMRDAAGALEHVKKANAANPGSAAAHELYLMAWKALGRPEEAPRLDGGRKAASSPESRPETRD